MTDSVCYGEFPNRSIIEIPCTIKTSRLDDLAPAALDIFGLPSFRRSGIAIHISGRDNYGREGIPGWIRALAMFEVEWKRVGQHPCGLGCEKPEPAVIVDTFFSETSLDVLNFSTCDGYVTLEGIYRWAGGRTFVPNDVIVAINEKRYERKEPWLSLGSNHRIVIRRLLEGSVGVSNNQITGVDGIDKNIGIAKLERVGRWSYRFAHDKWMRPWGIEPAFEERSRRVKADNFHLKGLL